MNRQAALDILRATAPELRRRYGVVNARLFGSVARGDHDNRSDVDVSITLEPGPGKALRLCGVSGLLSEVMGVDVDVVAEPASDPNLRAAIDRDGVRAF